MDNVKADAKSDIFRDDYGELVEQRCFLLLCGEGDANYMTLTNHINCFKEPREPWKLRIDLKINNTILEFCNEVISSQT